MKQVISCVKGRLLTESSPVKPQSSWRLHASIFH